jgi:hypothetical protein
VRDYERDVEYRAPRHPWLDENKGLSSSWRIAIINFDFSTRLYAEVLMRPNSGDRQEPGTMRRQRARRQEI